MAIPEPIHGGSSAESPKEREQTDIHSFLQLLSGTHIAPSHGKAEVCKSLSPRGTKPVSTWGDRLCKKMQSPEELSPARL
jgi:hypothetical protein